MDYNEIGQTELFRGLSMSDVKKLCDCLGASIRNYKKGETVVREGETLKRFGVVLGGKASSYKTDASGKVFTVSVINEGGYIGVLLAGGTGSDEHNRFSPVTVTARDRLTVLFIPVDRLIRQCSSNCRLHTIVIGNFISGISEKAMQLYERIDCLIKPTVREKVMNFLDERCKRSQTAKINIEFNREGLAEYLNIERSSLSRELSRMKNDGIIDYNKNTFTLL
ncbi:MAG: Crp/Fnr family transcriptional regulator [Oscillospiraceae bacterium]|nr:Crp/Fnr family transcriptional regulator [Oscillospiraceae bacterium]